jgi:hypothetical protein
MGSVEITKLSSIPHVSGVTDNSAFPLTVERIVLPWPSHPRPSAAAFLSKPIRLAISRRGTIYVAGSAIATTLHHLTHTYI